MKLLLLLSACVALAIAEVRFSRPRMPLNTPIDVSPRIVNGEEVKPHSIPFQAFLEITPISFCGGVLISNKFVLTAGHCTINAISASVWLGAHDTTKKEASQVKISSKKITVFPGYSEGLLVNDIAIIELQTPVEFNENIQPVKLPSRSDVNKTYAGEQARVSGWGLTNGRSQVLSPVLMAETSAVLTNRACEDAFNADNTNRRDKIDFGIEIICTSGAEQRSSCDGDSGGPLTTVADNTLVGLVSFGPQDCPPGMPSAYTRVTNYLDWIENNSDVTIAK